MDERSGGITVKSSPKDEIRPNALTAYSNAFTERPLDMPSPTEATTGATRVVTSPVRSIQARRRDGNGKYSATPSPARSATLFEKTFYSTSSHNSPWKSSFSASGHVASMRFKTASENKKPPPGSNAPLEQREFGSSYRDGSGARHPQLKTEHFRTDIPDRVSWDSHQGTSLSYGTTSPGTLYALADDTLGSSSTRSPSASYPPPQFPVSFNTSGGSRVGRRTIHTPETAASSSSHYIHRPRVNEVRGLCSGDRPHVPHSVTFSPSQAQTEYHSPTSGATDLALPFAPPRALTPRATAALETWYQRLHDLYEFKVENGHCNVPQKYTKNPRLGIWVNKQRMEHKLREDGVKSSMTDEKLHALEAVGFVWAKRRGEHSWLAKFEELRKYKIATGNCLVPTKYKPNPPLGRWVSTQRTQYKLMASGLKSTMTQARKAKLDSIDFAWSVLS